MRRRPPVASHITSEFARPMFTALFIGLLLSFSVWAHERSSFSKPRRRIFERSRKDGSEDTADKLSQTSGLSEDDDADKTTDSCSISQNPNDHDHSLNAQNCLRTTRVAFRNMEAEIQFAPVLPTSSSNHTSPMTVQLVAAKSAKMWPPWPFNLLTSSSDDNSDNEDTDDLATAPDPSRLSLLWSLTRVSARVGLNKARQVSSQMWFHLPPAAPPFLLLATFPQTQRIEALSNGGASTVTYRRIIPLISSPFARNVALSGFALAIFSYSHHELNHRRRLAPLPLKPSYRDLNRVVLPPFLPEEIADERMLETVMPIMDHESHHDLQVPGVGTSEEDAMYVPPRLRRHWHSLVGKAPKTIDVTTTIREWRRVRAQRRLERQNARRLAIYNELLALQSLKRKAKVKQPRREESLVELTNGKLGYALVTGASRGIGRAIAVELARYEIPLILVARDIDRLTSLAYDIEACYGVKCCVLQADLSKPDVAESIFNTTTKAGLAVDMLVNNAGFSLQGPSCDLPLRELHEMIQLNALSASTLIHLYGGEMKIRRRGRVLMLSSICGAVAGLPTVAVYAATKAFENSLALGLAKELEPHGVGVTCVMPGAVRDTDFKTRSKSEEALCWKIPFYTKTPQQVAEMAVRATLRGDTESTPGWQNRVFLKVMKPALPQRIHNIIAEMAWNPLRLPSLRRRHKPATSTPWTSYVTADGRDRDRAIENPEPQAPIRPSIPFQSPPLLLNLQKKEDKNESDSTSESQSNGLHEVVNDPETDTKAPQGQGENSTSIDSENGRDEAAQGNQSANSVEASHGRVDRDEVGPQKVVVQMMSHMNWG